jgi:Caspase domain
MCGRWWALFILAPLVAAAVPSDAPGKRWWGVVVGVGQYEHLDESLALDGPPNDVPLIVTWLARQGVPRRHLTVLADQVARADGLPTRASILDALRALPDRMAPGDMAFLYFAGHGSQQPQGGAQWSKTDGMDEIFLARDTGGWDSHAGQVEGAITGHDIGLTVEALRSRGIFVWLVFDSCHSATMARTLIIPHLRSRALTPSLLGVPAAAALSARGAASSSSANQIVKVQGSTRAAGYVAFYAAQTVDSAPEMPLPLGEPKNQVHGLFTYALLKALAATGAGSYREVAHRILAFYNSTYPATTPEFEGALDGAIGAPGAPLLNPGAWPVKHSGTVFRIDAGRLNGITPQTLLALYAAVPGSDKAAPLGLLRVTEVTPSDASAESIKDRKQLSTWKVPIDRSADVATGVARVLQTGVDTIVRVADPAACLASLPAPYGCEHAATNSGDGAAVAFARQLVRKPGCLPAGAELTPALDAADLYLLVRSRRLYVMQSATSSTHLGASIDLDSPTAAADLQLVMSRASRAVALLRLAAEFPGKPGELVAEARTREPTGGWRGIAGHAAPVTLGAELSLLLHNTSATDLDVTVLAIDDHFGISAVYPVDQESNLLRQGSARVEISGWARTPGTTQLVLIVEKTRAGRPHDLGYLAQPGIARNANGTGLAALLERIGFSARGTRTSFSPDERQESSIVVIRYEVSNGT